METMAKTAGVNYQVDAASVLTTGWLSHFLIWSGGAEKI